MIDWLEAHNPEAPFVVSESGTLTYGELAEQVRAAPVDSPTPLSLRLDVRSVVELFAAASSGGAIVLGPGMSAPSVASAKSSATVVATSGSTGKPKWVRLTIGNWRAAATASAEHLGHVPEDQWVLAMPLHHVGGLSILFRSAYVGSSVRLLDRFDPGLFAAALRDGGNLASVVATMLQRVLDSDDRQFSGLKGVLVGGGPIPPGLLERAADRGMPVLPSYGMTETCGQVATLRPGAMLGHHAHLLPGVEARMGEDGRLQIRGGMVSPGYLGEPDRGPADWFETDDLAEISNDGTVRILGRIDEMILTGGENVAPHAVESILRDHPDVVAALVTSVESAEWGQEVACLYEGDVSAGSLEDWAKERLPAHMVPKRWKQVSGVPTTALGKPDRVAARAVLAGD